MTLPRRMTAIHPYALVTLLLCSTATALHADTLEDFEATYRIKRTGLTLGSTRLSFRSMPDGRYTYNSTSAVGGFLSWLRKEHVRESSRGRMSAGRVRPDEYHFHRTGDRGNRLVRVSFDWQNNQAVNTVDGKAWQMDIQPGTLDKLVVQIAIMQQLGTGPSDLEFSIADGGRPKRYSIIIHGEETVSVPAGEFDTLMIEQQAENTQRKTILWAAPALGYLPVKIQREENSGAVYYSVLENVSLSGTQR